MTYLDTSFTLKLYVAEAESSEAIAIFQGLPDRAAVTSLTDVEVTASVSSKLPAADAAIVLTSYKRNRAQGVYQQLELDDAIYSLAVKLAEEFGTTLKLRSLDLLHLATAVHYGASALATYDRRLRSAVAAVGLSVLPTVMP